MLILSRKENECIRIGDDIVLMVVRVGPNHVRLGITAPKELPIVRPDAVRQEPRPRPEPSAIS